MIGEVLFPGPRLSIQDIQRFEDKYGIILPQGYREFMLAYNGGRPTPEDTFFVPGRTDNDEDSVGAFDSINSGNSSTDIELSIKRMKGRIPTDTIPIGFGACGDSLLLRVGGNQAGEVLLWDRDSQGDIYHLADSFDAFIAGLYEYESDE